MCRIPRVVIPGLPHHVTQRGNYRQSVFETDEDRKIYLSALSAAAELKGARIWAWCLMTNHVHLIVVPERQDSLGATFRLVHGEYARRIHERRGVTGHLWQARFFSCVLDRHHLLEAVRYVELNPVRAGLVRRPEEYQWSSAKAHMEGIQSSLLDPSCPLQETIAEWGQFLMTERTGSEDAMEKIRLATRTGRPAAGSEFVKEIETLTGLVLHQQRPGPKSCCNV